MLVLRERERQFSVCVWVFVTEMRLIQQQCQGFFVIPFKINGYSEFTNKSHQPRVEKRQIEQI